MSRRETPSAVPSASLRQRKILFSKTLQQNVATCDIEFHSLVQAGVRAENITASGLGLRFFFERGVDTAAKLCRFGFDSLSLCDAEFARTACSLYGAASVRDVFLSNENDAVNVAGEQCVDLLGISVNDLLVLCAGDATSASAVLAAESRRGLEGVSAQTLLDTGIRAQALKSLGIGMLVISQLADVRDDTCIKLGFRV